MWYYTFISASNYSSNKLPYSIQALIQILNRSETLTGIVILRKNKIGFHGLLFNFYIPEQHFLLIKLLFPDLKFKPSPKPDMNEVEIVFNSTESLNEIQELD